MTSAEQIQESKIKNPNCSTEHWLELDGLRIRYLRAGVPGSPPLVMVHGLLGYSFSWRFNLEALAQVAEVYALDLPGLGYSSRPAAGAFDASMPGLARFVLRWMDAVGIAQADVLGNSHGGAIAMFMAAAARERVRRLVLVAPVNPWSRLARRRIALLSSPVGAALAGLLLPPLLPTIQGLGVRRMYGDKGRIAPGTIAGYGAPLSTPGTLPHLLRVLHCWRHDVCELEKAIAAIADVPTLLVWGTRDRAVDPASAPELQRRLPGAKLVWLEGMGHLPYEEAPEEFNRAVIQFLSTDN